LVADFAKLGFSAIVQNCAWRFFESKIWACEVRFVGSQCMLFLFQAVSEAVSVEPSFQLIAMHCATYAGSL
jgi:hypothetical protein